MNIKKSEVHEALSKMEVVLFGVNMAENSIPVPRRLAIVFCEAYYRDYFPEESLILKESYKLLQNKDYYYTDEE